MEFQKFMPHKLVLEQINFWKNTFLLAMNSLSLFENQFEKMMTVLMKESSTLQEENQKMIKDWLNNCKKGRENYQKAVENSVGRIEELFSAGKNANNGSTS